MNDDESSEKCYGLKRSLRTTGSVCLLFYSTLAIGTPWFFLASADEFPRPVAAAILFGTFWSGWVLLSVWLLCAYYRERLFLAGDRVTKQGVIFRRSLAIAELSSVRWRGFPRQGSVVLRTSSTRIVIEFGNYESHVQDEIIAFVQQHAPPAITTGWDAFVNSRKPPPQLPPSRWVAALCGLIFLGTGCVLIYLWQAGLGLQWGLVGLVCLLCSVWYAVRIVRFRRAATTAS